MNRDRIAIGLFVLLLVNMLTVTFTIQPVVTSDAIHIGNYGPAQNMNEIQSDRNIHTFAGSTYETWAIQEDDTRSTVLAAQSQQVFDVRKEFGTGTTESIKWGDFDNDGDADLAVGNVDRDNYLYMNNGNGTFTPKTQFTTGPRQGITLAAGDYDNDGDLDIAVGTIGDHPLELYTNDGNGTFTLGQELGPGGYNVLSLAWGDHDNDGDLDLAAARGLQNKLYVNNGNGNFTEEDQFGSSSGFPASLAWADINGDGYIDLAVGSWGSNYIYVNDGNGTFTQKTICTERETVDLAWGDCDNDGDLDLALATQYYSGRPPSLYVNNGDGNFTEETPFRYPGEYLAWGDYDGDGNLDLAVARQDLLCIYRNNGNRTFSTKFIILYDHYGPLAWEDYDDDGDLDLAVGNHDYGQKSYLLVNQIMPNPPPEQPESQFVWVDDDWADHNLGDQVNGHVFGIDAFANIQSAIDAIESPGTVYVAAGTYVENINFLGKGITVKSESGPENTIIDGGGVGSVVTFESHEGLDSVLDGFKITNASGLNNHAIKCYRGSATIVNNVMKGNAGSGILLYMSTSVIRNNTIYGNPDLGSGPSDALHAVESSLIVENNTILATDPNGNIDAISIDGVLPRSVLISSNAIEGRIWVDGYSPSLTFEDEISNNIMCSAAIMVNIEGDATLSIVNNVIREGRGIDLQRGGKNTRILNNIITVCTTAIDVWSSSGSPEISNNDLWDDEIYYEGVPDQTGTNGNICADPLFVDVAGGNYHLKRRVHQILSPCIDTGTSEKAPDIDFDGNPRPIDGDGDGIKAVDMGAFEYALAHELDVYLEAPMALEPGASSLLNATVYNDGVLSSETVGLSLCLNGTTVDSATIPTLAIGKSYTLSFNWTSTGEATVNVTAYAPPVQGEIYTENNHASQMIKVVMTPYEPPAITIISPGNTIYFTSTVQLTLAFSEPVDWIGYSLNWPANKTITGNTTLSLLPDGWYTLIVYANDTCGNMGKSTAIFKIDTRVRIVGVKVGDWVKYGVTGNYTGLTGIDWIKIEITKVAGSNITVRFTGRMLNGTEPAAEDVDLATATSEGIFADVGFIVSANSTVGDIVSFGWRDITITLETNRTYGGANRTVVGVDVSRARVFWDKATGMLLEVSASYQDQTLNMIATSTSMGGGEPLSISWQIWIIIIATIAGAIVGAALGAVRFLRKRKRLESMPSPPEIQPPPSSIRVY